MASRLNLHEELCEILGTRNVYFSPPASVLMKYPAIRYSRSGVAAFEANNRIYSNINRYEIICIYTDPDSDLPDRVLSHFPMCSLDRFYVADNLCHAILTLYY